MKKKILIVDDDKAIIRYVGNILRDNGYEYAFVPRSFIVFERLDNEEFNLVLLDINMPNMDGITILKNLKINDKYHNIPVIMMTLESDEKTLKSCRQYGAIDIIPKPIDVNLMISKIKKVLE